MSDGAVGRTCQTFNKSDILLFCKAFFANNLYNINRNLNVNSSVDSSQCIQVFEIKKISMNAFIGTHLWVLWVLNCCVEETLSPAAPPTSTASFCSPSWAEVIPDCRKSGSAVLLQFFHLFFLLLHEQLWIEWIFITLGVELRSH